MHSGFIGDVNNFQTELRFAKPVMAGVMLPQGVVACALVLLSPLACSVHACGCMISGPLSPLGGYSVATTLLW